MAKAVRRRTRRIRPLSRTCYYCEQKAEPHFFDSETLARFITERGKIMPHSYTGICSKHQRHLTRHIKYARHLALLSFTQRVK